MKNVIVCVLSFFSVLALTHCQFQFQEIVDKSISKTQLAFICELKNGTNQTIPFITYTSNLGEPIKWDFNYGDSIDGGVNAINSPYYFNALKGASVEIFEDGKFFKKFSNSIDFSYRINYANYFNYGKEYTLKVFKEGYDSVIGKQFFPRDYFMDSNRIKLNKNTVVNSKYGGLALSELIFEIDDSMNEKNAYVFKAEINNSKTNDTIAHFGRQLPLYLIDKNALLANIITDSSFNGQKYFWHVGVNLDTMVLNRIFPPSPVQKLTIIVYFKAASLDYILYLKSQLNGGGFSINNPNTEPTGSFTNMRGGSGLFICSGQEYRIEIPLNY